MVMSQRFLVLNLAIVIMNVALGMLLNLAAFSTTVCVTERFVVLPDEAMDMQELERDMSALNWTDGSDGCEGLAGSDPRRQSLDPTRGLLDKSRVFKVHPFVFIGEDWANVSSEYQVCLSTQTSVDLLFWLVRHIEVWAGPISVAVFTPQEDYTVALQMIKYLKACNPEVKRRVSFHFSYPHHHPPEFVPSVDVNQKEYNCDAPEEVNKAFVKEIRSDQLVDMIKRSRYPQNLLRNVAREGCPSPFTFTPDVDMIPNPNMAQDLNTFLAQESVQNCDKCAYIIPIYEIHTAITQNPKDKNELKRLILRRKAQRFHVRAFPPNQANSNLIKWEKAKKSESLAVLYNITSYKNYWEPIYVTKAKVPPFDERFVGYGFTRNSQVFEMQVGNYKWQMLNNLFLSHRGFQTAKKHSAVRRKQISENNKRYKIFKKELFARYGANEADYEPKKKDKKTTTKKDTKAKTSTGDVKEETQGKDDKGKKEEPDTTKAGDKAAKEEDNQYDEVQEEEREEEVKDNKDKPDIKKQTHDSKQVDINKQIKTALNKLVDKNKKKSNNT